MPSNHLILSPSSPALNLSQLWGIGGGQSFWMQKPHGWRSLVGCHPWGRKESDTTERLHFHFSLSCIGEGNGNPLQCSCLENPRAGGAWRAAIYGIAESDMTGNLAAAAVGKSTKQSVPNTLLNFTCLGGDNHFMSPSSLNSECEW